MNDKIITVPVGKHKIEIVVGTITYILMRGDFAYIHRTNAPMICTKTSLVEIEKKMGKESLNEFIQIRRGCLVSLFAIHEITDRVYLGNGEVLEYSARNTITLKEEFSERRKKYLKEFADTVKPKTPEDFHEYYKVFDDIPIAFTDIEMVFDGGSRAVDWVFCYANRALAEIEQMPLEQLIGSRFGDVFPNMDDRWLKTYEWASLFGEVLQIIDYSLEIKSNLKIICFPTFKGHCGCILFDVAKLRFFRQTTDTDHSIAAFVGKMLGI